MVKLNEWMPTVDYYLKVYEQYTKDTDRLTGFGWQATGFEAPKVSHTFPLSWVAPAGTTREQKLIIINHLKEKGFFILPTRRASLISLGLDTNLWVVSKDISNQQAWLYDIDVTKYDKESLKNVIRAKMDAKIIEMEQKLEPTLFHLMEKVEWEMKGFTDEDISRLRGRYAKDRYGKTIQDLPPGIRVILWDEAKAALERGLMYKKYGIGMKKAIIEPIEEPLPTPAPLPSYEPMVEELARRLKVVPKPVAKGELYYDVFFSGSAMDVLRDSGLTNSEYWKALDIAAKIYKTEWRGRSVAGVTDLVMMDAIKEVKGG